MVLVVSLSLAVIGIVSILVNRKDLVRIVLSIELMLLGISSSMVVISVMIDDVVGQVFTIIVMTVAASEAAVGLGLIVSYFRIVGNVEIGSLNLIQG